MKSILMNNYKVRMFAFGIKSVLFFIIFSSLTGCEKVVKVDLKTEPPRLVIDASINWEKGTTGNAQVIKLTTTTGYYQDAIPVVSGASVSVTNSANTVFNFIETPGTGNYVCGDFIPVVNEQYQLKVIYKGETYTAAEKLIATPTLMDVEQVNDLGFNNDEIGLKINFSDAADQRNFYLFRTDFAANPFPEYQVVDDRFEDGNIIPWFYAHEKLVQGKTLNFTHYGISENYSNYMRLMIGASSGANNGPFQVVPTKVRGNIVNQTNIQNYALGYFRLGEISKLQYLVK